ncbi:hypothetical protein [Rhodovulum sulfidophilum]|uniref:hypothetical protein n=1 Tax=Rhodovulum sulfidophilum TaxID=35806 RepID=UPI001924CD58|nr:hypothetical protein [Rhodovulum sulfidophilum]MBL3560625.1 hypothetical protein [Rhodovulum sulfidophilum]
MSYCFIANYHLTPLQIEIARRIEQEGTSCVFVTVNNRLAQEIAEAGWAGERLLHLTFDPEGSEPEFNEVAICYNDLLVADRALRYTPEAGLHFLYRSARKLRDFFELHDVRFVFSEPTWAHERLAAALCAASGRRTFLTPFTIRYPSGRFAFFKNGDQDRLYPIGSSSLGEPTQTLVDIANSPPPSYLKRNDQLLKQARTISARIGRLRRFITRERIDPRDPTHIQSRWHTLQTKGGEEIKRILYRFVSRQAVDQELLQTPFVLYAMHKQPESSIDVLGRYYDDQSALLLAIWRSLPSGWNLLVKEHTNAIGDRAPSFYRNLQRWPGLRFIDEKTPMPMLLERTQAVFTVSGTVAYEAALKGIPAFTFAPMFFNQFDRCQRITIDDLRTSRNIAELIETLPPANAATNDIVASEILRNSFAGRFTDIVSDPTVLDPTNIEDLMAGFRELKRAAGLSGIA